MARTFSNTWPSRISTACHYDVITNFDSAKDVIDLSRIDADPATAGLQNFTFIGTSAFSSAGDQVRYWQDAANNCTWVEATMAGDSSPDLEIKLDGLHALTAADFALTATQSKAVMTAGATKVATSSLSLGLNQTEAVQSAGMTQAQDLAAVLGHATSSSSAITIKNPLGDGPALTGIAAAITANAAHFPFA